MKYKVGDKVKIRSKEWYEKSKDEYGDVECDSDIFIGAMNVYCGMDAIIKADEDGRYSLDIDSMKWHWSEEMFEDQNA